MFGINTYDGWYSPATQEFDIYVDVDGDSVDDYVVVGADQGAVTTGTFNGRMATFVFSTRSPGASLNFFATARTNSTTAELPVLNTQLCRAAEPCLNAANPRLSYHAVAFDLNTGAADVVAGTAKYNMYTPAMTDGDFQVLAPGASSTSSISVDPTEWALTPALGAMVLSLDNKNSNEANLIPKS